MTVPVKSIGGILLIVIGLLIIALNPSRSPLQISIGSFLLILSIGMYIIHEKYGYFFAYTFLSLGLTLTIYNYFANPQLLAPYSPFLLIGGISWGLMILGPLCVIAIKIGDDSKEGAAEFFIGSILVSIGIVLQIVIWGSDSYLIFTGILLIVMGVIIMIVGLTR